MEIKYPANLDDILNTDNQIVDLLDDKDLDTIGRIVVEDYITDNTSRSDYMKQSEVYMDLAMQVMEEKTFPWKNAANVKYPLLTTAALQFASRAYQALLPNRTPVKGRVVGKDRSGNKLEQATRVAMYMSYQILEEMEEWEEDMDRLCIIVPIAGCVFKKTYFDPSKARNVSELVSVKDLVVNYYAKSLETASRKTHVLQLSKNDVLERVRMGLYRKVSLPEPKRSAVNNSYDSDKRNKQTEPGTEDSSLPYTILEQHRWLDLDGDDYEEPYIVYVEENSKKVLRIVARFDTESVQHNSEDEVYKITSDEYFTKFGFIPNPDGGFYDIGFGILLGGLNDAANTIMNQLIDAGTMSILQAGFLGKGIRLKGGNTRFKPGEWKFTESYGNDLKANIVPLPTREPSGVLFNLLGLLIDSGKDLASVTDMMLGQNPGQNQPATTSMAVLEQGLQVFSSIYKRLHRSLKKEYMKLFKLNYFYLDEEVYFNIMDVQGEDQVGITGYEDFDLDTISVLPASDPNIVSDAQKYLKAQALMELLPIGTVNPQEVTKRVLDAQDQPGIDQLMAMPESKPDPAVMLEITKAKQENALAWAEIQVKAADVSSEIALREAQALAAIAKAEAADDKLSLDFYKAALEKIKMQSEIVSRLPEGGINDPNGNSGMEGPPSNTGDMEGIPGS